MSSDNPFGGVIAISMVLGFVVAGYMSYVDGKHENDVALKYCEETKPARDIVLGELVMFNETGEIVRVSRTDDSVPRSTVVCKGHGRRVRITFRDGVSIWVQLDGVTLQEHAHGRL